MSSRFDKIIITIAVGNITYAAWMTWRSYRGWSGVRKSSLDQMLDQGQHGALAIEAAIHSGLNGISALAIIYAIPKILLQQIMIYGSQPTPSGAHRLMLVGAVGFMMITASLFSLGTCYRFLRLGLRHYKMYREQRSQ